MARTNVILTADNPKHENTGDTPERITAGPEGTYTIWAGGGSDIINLTSLVDPYSRPTGGMAYIYGGAGADRITIKGGEEVTVTTMPVEYELYAQATIWGSDGADRIDASQYFGRLRVEGGKGPDTIFSGHYRSEILTEPGDKLILGEGEDIITFLPEGDDADPLDGVVKIRNFEVGVDTLDLSGLGEIADPSLGNRVPRVTIDDFSVMGNTLIVDTGGGNELRFPGLADLWENYHDPSFLRPSLGFDP